MKGHEGRGKRGRHCKPRSEGRRDPEDRNGKKGNRLE